MRLAWPSLLLLWCLPAPGRRHAQHDAATPSRHSCSSRSRSRSTQHSPGAAAVRSALSSRRMHASACSSRAAFCAAQGCRRAWRRGRPPVAASDLQGGFDVAVPLCCGAPDFDAQERFLRAQPNLACLKCLLCAARRGVRSVCGWTHDGVAVVPAVRYRHATSHEPRRRPLPEAHRCTAGVAISQHACLRPRTPPSALSAHLRA
jgi:hypothetical protein